MSLGRTPNANHFGFLASSNISSTSIVDNTVTSADIQDATISGSDIAANTVTNSNIANNTITGAKIANSTITGSNIATGAVTGANIGSSTITGSNIATSTITASHLTPNAAYFVINFGGPAVNNEFFVSSGVFNNAGTSVTQSVSNRVVLPSCTLRQISYFVTNGASDTVLVLFKDTTATTSIPLSGTSGIIFNLTDVFTSGTSVSLQKTTGTNPGNSTFHLFFQLN